VWVDDVRRYLQNILKCPVDFAADCSDVVEGLTGLAGDVVADDTAISLHTNLPGHV
jgi:hypothetical protein